MALTQPDTPVAVAHVALRYLSTEREPVSREALVKRLAPLGETQEKAANQTLTGLEDAGVLEDDGERITISAVARDARSESEAISDCLFSGPDATALWEKDRSGALSLNGGIDLIRGLAWLLTLDAFDGPYSYDKGANQTAKRQEAELGVQVVANRERWLPFARWAGYLGFGRLVDGRLAVDPTKALKRVLSRASSSKSLWTHQELVELVGKELPVLDGGAYRAAVLDRRASHSGGEETEWDLSPALTLGLLVLRDLGQVELAEGSGDADKARLAHGLGALHRLEWTPQDDR